MEGGKKKQKFVKIGTPIIREFYTGARFHVEIYTYTCILGACVHILFFLQTSAKLGAETSKTSGGIKRRAFSRKGAIKRKFTLVAAINFRGEFRYVTSNWFARAWISRCLLKHPLRNPLKSIRRKFAEVVDLRRSIETRLKFRKRFDEREREKEIQNFIYFVVYNGFILNTFLIFFHGIKIKLGITIKRLKSSQMKQIFDNNSRYFAFRNNYKISCINRFRFFLSY